MQSEHPNFDLTASPSASLASSAAAPSPATLSTPLSALGAEVGYTPRTVWQTPNGLAPTFSRSRGARLPGVPTLVRRCLRLMSRQSHSQDSPPPSADAWPRCHLSMPS